jgi:hypothetical protein
MPPSWFNLQAYAFDKPVQYKKLIVYPVKMESYFEFSILVESLLLEKNTTLEGISKTYLDYLYMLNSKNDENNNLGNFDSLLKLCLRKPELSIFYGHDKKEKPVFVIYKNEEDSKKNKDGEIYDSSDFDELRLLICEQNDIKIPDDRISPEVRASMEEARAFRAKINGVIPPTLEDLVLCVMASTSLKPDDISNLSIRKFGQLIQRIDSKLHYQIYLTAAMSGMVEFKDKSILKHWMSGTEEDMWGDTMIDVETIRGKLAFDDKKEK